MSRGCAYVKSSTLDILREVQRKRFKALRSSLGKDRSPAIVGRTKHTITLEDIWTKHPSSHGASYALLHSLRYKYFTLPYDAVTDTARYGSIVCTSSASM